MIEIVVLGSGTSSGVPVLGVDYPREYLANPKNHRTRPAILIKGSGGNVLVDAGPDLRMQLLRENINQVDATVITHTHADHIMGMDDLRSFCLRTKRDMPVYTMPRYAEDIRRVFSYAFGEFPEGIEVPRFALSEVDLEATGTYELVLCDIPMTLMLVWHGPWPVIALRIQNFAYVTDVKTIPQPAWDLLQGLDVLILDAVRRKPHPNHIHFDEAIDIAQKLGAGQTYFTHLSHDFDHDVTNSQLPPNIQLAFDGQRISVT